MSLDQVFGQVPEPQSHSVPDYSLPRGDPGKPIALTAEEFSTLVDLYDAFSTVDPTGMDSNPFLRATGEFLQQTLDAPLTRPDEQSTDDIAALLTDFSDGLGGASTRPSLTTGRCTSFRPAVRPITRLLPAV